MNLKDVVGNLESSLEGLQNLIKEKETEMMSKINTMSSEEKRQVLPHLAKYQELKDKAKKEGLKDRKEWDEFADSVKADVSK